MPGRIIDVSSNNHPNGVPIDWPKVKAAGVTTAIVKATEGTGYTNPYYASDIAGAKGAGLDVLAYHFAGTGDPVAEANHFASVAGRLARVLDVETTKNVPWDRAFLAQLGWAHDQCMTYGSASTLVDIYRQLPSMAWPAAYGQGYPGWGVLWQFTSSAKIPGIATLVDENQWHGSEIQYETLFGLLEPPAPIPAPSNGKEDGMIALEVTENGKQVTKIYCASPQDHLLEFTRIPGSQQNSVIDITNEIGLTANNGGPFLVQP